MRKRLDPNEIIIKLGYAEMILYNVHQNEIARTLIPLDKVEDISKIRWSLTEYGYVRGQNKETKKHVFLHNFILQTDKFVDHKNTNKLDNRYNNLRECTKAQNSMNRKPPINNTAGYTGVSFDKRRNKYRAYIKLNGKQIFLGYFNKFEEAKNKRLEAEDIYFKDFRYKCDEV